jgi:hypothetical protein
VLWLAECDRATIVDEDRRHPYPVDVHTGLAAVDGDPLAAVEVQQHLRF